MFWAVAVGAISLILFLLWHFIGNKKRGWRYGQLRLCLERTGGAQALEIFSPLFNGGTLAIPDLHLASIAMFQFFPIFTIVALVSTYFFRQTGHVFVGSFINALLVTWIVVAGQATHFSY